MNTLSKDIVEKLYHKEGLSTIKIAKKLGVSVWVVLGFMRRNKIIRRTFKEANAVYFSKQPISFLLKKKLNIQEEKIKAAGVFLYWGEGAQYQGKNCSVDLANSNPEMIEVFLIFLRKICGVDERKLRVFMYCYSNQNVDNLMKYWHDVTSIPLSQFTKPYIRKDFQEHGRKMEHGLIHIRYADKKLLIQIDAWIKEYCKKFKIMIE